MKPSGDHSNLWRYVHGETNPDERTEIERAIESDPDLGMEADRIRRTDERLRELMPAALLTDDELADRILSEMDAPRIGGHETDTGSRTLSFPAVANIAGNLVFRRTLIGLAAAALVLIVVLPRQATQPIRWNRPHFDSMHYRGAERTVNGLSKDEAAAGFDLLRQAVTEAYQSGRTVPPESPVTLDFTCSATVDGNICVQIKQLDNQRNTVKEWIQQYSNANAFADGAGTLANLIVNDLGAQNGNNE